MYISFFVSKFGCGYFAVIDIISPRDCNWLIVISSLFSALHYSQKHFRMQVSAETRRRIHLRFRGRESGFLMNF